MTCDRHLSINSASDCKRHTSEGKLTDTNTLIQLVIIHIFFHVSQTQFAKPISHHTQVLHVYTCTVHLLKKPLKVRGIKDTSGYIGSAVKFSFLFIFRAYGDTGDGH